MAAFKDITGQRFGRWVVQQRAASVKHQTHWVCICDCGVIKSISDQNLKSRRSQSCGCYRKERSKETRSHGHTAGYKPSPEYRSWQKAKERCFNPNADNFNRYGGRGITMCAEWSDDFSAFLKYMGQRPDGCDLDRIDNNGNYEPGNCRWATRKIQLRNTSVTLHITHNGETLSLSEWSERTGICLWTLHSRLKRGLPLFDPVRRGAK
jgi:hypothetical protein